MSRKSYTCLSSRPNPSFLISIHAGPNFFAFRVFLFPRLKTAVVYRMNENLGGEHVRTGAVGVFSSKCSENFFPENQNDLFCLPSSPFFERKNAMIVDEG